MAFTIPSSHSESLTDKAFKQRNQLEEFCEETTLNGWYYLAKKSVGKIGRSYWVVVVMSSLALSGWFIYTATNEYLDASVIITVDSVTASLDKVIFPSVVICNQNQVLAISKMSEFVQRGAKILRTPYSPLKYKELFGLRPHGG